MPVDAFLLRGLVIALAAGALAPLVLRTASPGNFAWFGLPAAALFYGPDVAGFLAVCGLGFLVAQILGAVEDRSLRWRLAGAAILILAVFFTAGRASRWGESTVAAGGASLRTLVFDMWLALRLVTLFWEVGSGGTAAPALAEYLGWVTFPMTLGGPLVRLSEFPTRGRTNPALWRSAAWWAGVAAAALKFAAGITLSNLSLLVPTGSGTLDGVLRVLLAGPLGFYLTFAGYFHLMQALAAPAGVTIPDSFNSPIGRENISAFWGSWNMTATRVFRDYLFFNRWGFRHYNVYVNTLVLFVLVGLWHGANPYWALFGLLHGIMFCVFLAWRGRASPPATETAGAPRWTRSLAGRVATYLAVCAAWYFPSKILAWLGVN